MPELDAVETGNPCWIDIMTSDPAATTAFYTALLGWEAERPSAEHGGYINFTKDGSRIAGAMANQEDGQPDVWSVYIAVDDAAATVAAVEAAGGSVMVPPMEVGSLGTMAVFTDVGGAVLGLWQPGEHTGFGYVAEDGAPGWFELFTRDYDAVRPFYEQALGWDLHTAVDQPGFRYTTLHDGDAQAAGIMDSAADLPEGVPAHWSVYFQVADVDATIARAESLGAKVDQPAQDTPYGRLAVMIDPTGAQFKLIGPNLEG